MPLPRAKHLRIGAMTMDEYRKYIEKDAALRRKTSLCNPPVEWPHSGGRAVMAMR
jgi:hypothetical protein